MRPIWLSGVGMALAAFMYAQAPAVNSGGVVNSGSYAATGVAPGSIISIFGTNLAGGTAGSAQVPLPNSLNDVVSVTFNDISAPLFFVSSQQINAQLPWNVLSSGASSGIVNVVVTRTSGASAPQSVQVAAVAPGIFTVNEKGNGQAIATDNADGAVAAPVGVGTSHPIQIGDYLIIWCTGLGPVSPPLANGAASSDQLRYTAAKPSVLIGGVPATFVYSVLSPQFVGANQIGVQVAAGTPTGNAIPLQIQVNGITTSDQVTIAVAPGTPPGSFHTLTPEVTLFTPGAGTLPGLGSVTFATASGSISKDRVGYQGGDFVNGKVLYYPWSVSNGGEGIQETVTNSVNQGVMLSYDAKVTGFNLSSQWKFFDMTTLSTPGAANARGYNGAVVSSDGHVYLVPHGHQDGLLPTFVDYDSSKEITDPTAYQTVGAPARGGALGDTYGWCTGVFDGTYIYYIPGEEDPDGPVPGAHGNVARYNTTTPFDLTNGEWAHFDMAASYPGAAGFQSGAYDGHRFIYYVPFLNTVLVRYDTQYGTPGTPNPAAFTNPAAYTTLAPTSLSNIAGEGDVSNLRGFTGAQVVWDASQANEYLYLVPWGSFPVVNGIPTLMSTTARVRIGTQSGSTWSYVDITGTDTSTASPNWEMFDLNILASNPQWQLNGWPQPPVYPFGGPLSGQSMIAGWQLAFVNTSGPSPRVGFGANVSQFWVEHDVGHALADPFGWYVAKTPSQLRPGTFGGAYDAVNQIFYPASPSVPLIQANGL